MTTLDIKWLHENLGYSRVEFKRLFNYVDESEVENEINPTSWISPSPPPERNVEPSALFMGLLERLHQCWDRNKEATTRTYIDQVILDVLWGRRDMLRTNMPLSTTLVVEAKVYRGDSHPWQLLSIMAHYQSVKKAAQKLTTVYGILTDSEDWTFYRLDNNSKVWCSRKYSFSREKKSIWKFIDYIIDTAERLSPT